MSSLTKDQIEDLLYNVVCSTKINYWKNDKINFNCPIHKEKQPSCGIILGYKIPHSSTVLDYFHCFSCGKKGSIPYFLFLSLPDKFRNIRQSEKFLEKRYGVNYNYHYDDKSGLCLKQYDDFYLEVEDSRHMESITKLAAFKSGKETFDYFYTRGFDKEDVKEYKIGMDTINQTVTMPVFWEDKKLAGIIGRYIDPDRPKNMRFKIYDFPKGSLIFPLDKIRAINNTLIVVESQIDCMLLRKWGYINAVAIMGDSLSDQQSQQIEARCDKLIVLYDLDKGGDTALEITYKKLGKKLMILQPNWYPSLGKDVADWGEENCIKIINSARFINKGVIPVI